MENNKYLEEFKIDLDRGITYVVIVDKWRQIERMPPSCPL